MSDRILVMHQGKQNGIFAAASATQESIMTAATGGSAQNGASATATVATA
jgi:ribose transport system ATP-binding protein